MRHSVDLTRDLKPDLQLDPIPEEKTCRMALRHYSSAFIGIYQGGFVSALATTAGLPRE